MVRMGTSESKFVFDSLEPVTIISSTSSELSSCENTGKANIAAAKATNEKRFILFIAISLNLKNLPIVTYLSQLSTIFNAF